VQQKQIDALEEIVNKGYPKFDYDSDIPDVTKGRRWVKFFSEIPKEFCHKYTQTDWNSQPPAEHEGEQTSSPQCSNPQNPTEDEDTNTKQDDLYTQRFETLHDQEEAVRLSARIWLANNKDLIDILPNSSVTNVEEHDSTIATDDQGEEDEDGVIARILTKLVDTSKGYDKIVKDLELILLGTTVYVNKSFWVKLLAGFAAATGVILDKSILLLTVDNLFPLVFGTTEGSKISVIINEFIHNTKRKSFMRVVSYLMIPLTTGADLTKERLIELYGKVKNEEDIAAVIKTLAEAETYVRQAFDEYHRSKTLIGFSVDKASFKELVEEFHVLNLEKERVKRDPGYVAQWSDIISASNLFSMKCRTLRKIENEMRVVEAINRMEIAILELVVIAKASNRMGKLQRAPYAIVMTGPTGVGKTEPQNYLGRLVFTLMNDREVRDDEIVNIRGDAKFPAIKSQTKVLIMDDLNNKVVTENGESSLDLVNQIVNNVPWYVNAAEAQDKNKIVPAIDTLIASSNTTNLQAEALTIEPGSALRRFHLHIRVLPAAQYRKGSTLQLDASKVPACKGIPTTHTFTVQKVEMEAIEPPVATQLGKPVKHVPASYKFNTVVYQGRLLEGVDLKTVTDFLKTDVSLHVANQTRFVSMANSMRIDKICLECGFDKEDCHCDNFCYNCMIPGNYNDLDLEPIPIEEVFPPSERVESPLLQSIWPYTEPLPFSWGDGWGVGMPLSDNRYFVFNDNNWQISDPIGWYGTANFEGLVMPVIKGHQHDKVMQRLTELPLCDMDLVLRAMEKLQIMTPMQIILIRAAKTTPARPTDLLPNSFISSLTSDGTMTTHAFLEPKVPSFFAYINKKYKKMWRRKRFSTYMYGGKSEFEYELSLVFGYDPDNNNVYYRLFRAVILLFQAVKATRILHPAVHLPDMADQSNVEFCVSVMNEDEFKSVAYRTQMKRFCRSVTIILFSAAIGPYVTIPYLVYKARGMIYTACKRVNKEIKQSYQRMISSPQYTNISTTRMGAGMVSICSTVRTKFKSAINFASSSEIVSRVIPLSFALVAATSIVTLMPAVHLLATMFMLAVLPSIKITIMTDVGLLAYESSRMFYLITKAARDMMEEEVKKIMRLRAQLMGVPRTTIRTLHAARITQIIATADPQDTTQPQTHTLEYNSEVLQSHANIHQALHPTREFYEDTTKHHSKKGQYIMTGDQLENTVVRNTAMLQYEHDGFLHRFAGLFVSTGLLLIPRHCFFKDRKVLECTIRNHPDGTPYMFTTYLHTEDARLVGHDAILIPVTKTAPFKDIRRLFAPSGVEWPAKLYRARKTDKGFSVVESGVVTDRDVVAKCSSNAWTFHGSGATYTAPPSVSFSGSPVFSTSQPMIYGLHVAQYGNLSFAIRVTREALIREEFTSIPTPLSISEYFHGEPLQDKTVTNNFTGKQYELSVLGFLQRPHEPSDAWSKSAISDELEEAGIKRTHISPYCGNKQIDGKMAHMEYAARKVDVVLDQSVLNDAAKAYWSPFKTKAKLQNIRPLNMGEVINGTSHSAWCAGADMSTAMNYPFSGIKSEWADQVDGVWKMRGEFFTAYDEICRLLLKGEIPVLVAYLKNKMEQRLEQQPGKAKTPRQYCAVPFLLNVLINKYFDPVWSLVFDNPILGEALVGIDPHDVRQVIRVIEALENCDINSIDYSKFDATANSQAVQAYLMEMIEVAAEGNYTETDFKMMRAIVRLIITPLINVDGALTVLQNIVPSGIAGTSYIDGGVSSVLKRYHFNKLYPGVDFRKAVQLLTYGDDNCEGRKKMLGFVKYPKYTPESYAEFANDIGMVVTSTTKEGRVTHGIDIISRKFEYVEHFGKKRPVAKLKKESIFKSLHGHIVKPGTDYDAVLQDNITRAFMEISLHGKAETEALMTVMMRIQNPLVSQHPIVLGTLSYKDICDLYEQYSKKSVPLSPTRTMEYNMGVSQKGGHESDTRISRVPTAILQATGQFARYVSNNAPRAILAIERWKEPLGYIAMALGNSRPHRVDAPQPIEPISTPHLSNFNMADNVKRLTWDVQQGLGELKTDDPLGLLSNMFRRWSYIDYIETTSAANVGDVLWSCTVDPKTANHCISKSWGSETDRVGIAMTNVAAAAAPFQFAAGSMEYRFVAYAPMSVTFTAKITYDPHSAEGDMPPLNTQHTYIWNVTDDPTMDIVVNNGQVMPFARMPDTTQFKMVSQRRGRDARWFGFGTLTVSVFSPVNAIGTTAEPNSLCIAVYIRGGENLEFMGTSPEWQDLQPMLKVQAPNIREKYSDLTDTQAGASSENIEFDGTQTHAPTIAVADGLSETSTPTTISPTTNTTQTNTTEPPVRHMRYNAYEWQRAVPKQEQQNTWLSLAPIAVIAQLVLSAMCIGCLNANWGEIVTQVQRSIKQLWESRKERVEDREDEQIYIPVAMDVRQSLETAQLKSKRRFKPFAEVRPNNEVVTVPMEETETFITHDTFTTFTDDSASLDKWLGRDIVLYEERMEDGHFKSTSINPWVEFLNNGFVRDKLSYTFAIRATLVFNIMIGESKVHAGAVMVAYRPNLADEFEYNFLDAAGNDKATSTEKKLCRLTLLSNADHVVVSPQYTTRVTMKVPFFWDKEFVPLVGQDINQLGKLYISSLVPLRKIGESAGIPDLPFTILMHLEDVEYKGATATPMPTYYNGGVTINEQHKTTPQLPLIYGGESIVSIKQLMKRSTQLFISEPSSQEGTMTLFFPALPPYPGYSTAIGSHMFNNKHFNAINMTPATYFRSMYVGVRGSSKFIIFQYRNCAACPSMVHKASITHAFLGIVKDTQSGGVDSMFQATDNDGPHFLGSETSTHTNPTLHIEVPHQTNHLFQRSRNTDYAHTYNHVKYVVYNNDGPSQEMVYYTPGEDFQLIGYLGPPLMMQGNKT
jgi:hypothetical protein